MKSRILVMLLITLFAFGTLFAGCGATPAKDSDTIIVAVDDTYPPMEFKDDNNQLVGFDVDLAKALGEKLGKKIEFKSIAWDGIFAGLDAGNYDCIISSVSMTPDRMEKYEFTKPYLANGQVIVVKPGDTSITKPEDLAGKKVGVQTNTTSDTSCTKQLEKTQFELKRYDEIIQTFEAMSAGHIDCIVVDYGVAVDYTNKMPEKYAISTAKLTNEPIAVCIKKGNTKLRDDMQKALEQVKSEGKLTEISKKWFDGNDLTVNIDENLF